MAGGIIIGVMCTCSSCKKYSAYLPCKDLELAKKSMQEKCPECGGELVFHEVEDKGY